MRKVSNTFDDELQDHLAFLGFLTADQRLCLPDWMVVAPPKTGTSWVYANLRRHPEAFAVDLKELKYFSNRFELEDLRNYLAHFRSGADKTKGEASPSYSLLPTSTIRLIRALVPDLKLIYLMREPIGRAWSHARHNCREHEATFKRYTGRFEDVSEEQWIECLTDDWNRLSGDYLGQLQRWLSVFPREQVYLGFFEEIVHSPRRLLRELLEFLELDPGFSDSEDVILERVNSGIPKDLPPKIHQYLTALHADRTRELTEYLHDEHGMTVPMEWAEALGTTIPSAPLTERLPAVSWEIGDEGLTKLLSQDDLLERDFLGYHILRRETGFIAYPMSLGPNNTEQPAPQVLSEQLAAGNCLAAPNPQDLKSLIVRRCLARDVSGSETARIRQLEQQLTHVESFQGDLQATISKIALEVRNVEQAQSASGQTHADLHARYAEIAERLNSLKGLETQILESLASVRNECRKLSEGYQALELGQREILEFSQALQHEHELLKRSHDDLLRSHDALLGTRGDLLRTRDELIQSRDEMQQRLERSNYRIQETEVELFSLRGRVSALENSLVFRTLRRIDSWLMLLRLVKPPRPIQEPLVASIESPNGHPTRNGHNNANARYQTAVDEKGSF
jgi:hypothetical protein